MILNKLFKKSNSIYLITDTNISGLSHVQTVRLAVAAGIRTIQIREKSLTKKEIYNEALAIRGHTKKYGVTFIVNDYVDIALAVDADGVHLGQDDMPVEEARKIMGKRKIIGVSTHNLKQAIHAENSGADYIGFGPMFRTGTKDAGKPRGLKNLEKIRKHIRIPIVAIGGIARENVSDVLSAGADACAVISGILSGNIKNNVKGYINTFQNRHLKN